VAKHNKHFVALLRKQRRLIIMDNNLIIRKYQNEDHAEVIGLHRLVLQKEHAYRGVGVWEEDLTDIENVYLSNKGAFLIGLMDKKIIAMAGLLKIDTKTAEVVRMRVHPNFQGKGYGKTMLLKIEQEAKKLRYKELILETDQRLKNATQLYLKNGYVFWKEEYLNGFNCFWYRKDLYL
jgi:GNAT superfamily N-acetyltransferase